MSRNKVFYNTKLRLLHRIFIIFSCLFYFSFPNTNFIVLAAISSSNSSNFKPPIKTKLVVQDGHYSVSSVAFSPDGKYFLSAGSGRDNTIKLWTLDGRLVHSFSQHISGINKAVFSPNGQLIASCGKDDRISLMTIDGNILWTILDAEDYPLYIAFSSDGKNLITSNLQCFKIWSTDGKLVRRILFEVKDKIRSYPQLDPQENYIAIADGSHVEFYNLNGVLIRELNLAMEVHEITFSSDGNFILVDGADGQQLYSRDGKRLLNFPSTSPYTSWGTNDTTFSNDNRFIIRALTNGEADHGMIEIRTQEGDLVRRIPTPYRIDATAVSQDRKYILCGGYSNLSLLTFTGQVIFSRQRHLDAITSISLTPLEDKIICGTSGGYMMVWGIAGPLLRRFQPFQSNYPIRVQLSPDGKRVLAAQTDDSFTTWPLDSKPTIICKPHRVSHGPMPSSLTFGPHEKLFIGGYDASYFVADKDGQLLETVEARLSWDKPTGCITGIAITSDSRYVVTGHDWGQIQIRNQSGELIKEFETPGRGDLNSIAISPDSKYIAVAIGANNPLAVGNDYVIDLYTFSGRRVKSFVGHEGSVNCVQFTPDGKRLISGGSDNTIRVWSLDGRNLKTFYGYENWVNTLVVSKDGRKIISGGEDGTIRIWDIDTGEIAALTGYDDNWIVATSEGYFDASRDGGCLLGITKGRESFGIEQFAIRRNRPDILLTKLGSGTVVEKNFIINNILND